MPDSDFVKFVAVPVSHADDVRAALCRAGAGSRGITNIAVGRGKCVGRFIHAWLASGDWRGGYNGRVEEEVLRQFVTRIFPQCYCGIKKAHPYEEPPVTLSLGS